MANKKTQPPNNGKLSFYAPIPGPEIWFPNSTKDSSALISHPN